MSLSIQTSNSYEINQLWETLKNKNSSRNTISEAFAACRNAFAISTIDPESTKLLRQACFNHPEKDFTKQKIKFLLKTWVPAPSIESKNYYVSLMPDAKGNTLLHVAAQFGQLSIMTLLIEAEVNIECQSNEGATPYHIAAQLGQVGAMQLHFLVQHGADIEASLGHESWCYLHVAASLGQTHLVQKLLELGADKNALSDNGQRPIDIARQYNQMEAVEMLQ
ncbi:MAG: hypothetical protein S4CHLAM123_09030 [Chlamydiales bacterium]|nr:hypothetical protein [Chlamydiales bacterium]